MTVWTNHVKITENKKRTRIKKTRSDKTEKLDSNKIQAKYNTVMTQKKDGKKLRSKKSKRIIL